MKTLELYRAAFVVFDAAKKTVNWEMDEAAKEGRLMQNRHARSWSAYEAAQEAFHEASEEFHRELLEPLPKAGGEG